VQLKTQGATLPVAAEIPNRTGLPDPLKTGVETLSGLAMDDVRVHRNSPEPARLGALAYTQGSDIHLGPGQEQHLPHEAWHVVQQKQGRVKTTTQMKGVGVNEDAALEAEATAMGERSVAQGSRDTLSPVLGGNDAVEARTMQLRRDPDAVALSQQLSSEKDTGAEAEVESAAAAWPRNTYEIGRFSYYDGDFSGAALVPQLAGNVATILNGIRNSTATCWMDSQWTPVEQARAAGLNIPVRVSDGVFPDGLSLRVTFFQKNTKRPQQASDRFADLLQGMPGQTGSTMGQIYYKK
jgi:hypothetical protein